MLLFVCLTQCTVFGIALGQDRTSTYGTTWQADSTTAASTEELAEYVPRTQSPQSPQSAIAGFVNSPCGEVYNSSSHTPLHLKVSELVSGVQISWKRPSCKGLIRRYSISVDDWPALDSVVACSQQECIHELDTAVCDFCLSGNAANTFRVAAMFESDILLPEAAVVESLDVQPCIQMPTPQNAVSLCRGPSEVRSASECQTDILWKKQSSCSVTCQDGFGFFDAPADHYTCTNASKWSPSNEAPGCYKIAPVSLANLRYSVVFPLESVQRLEHQFEGLILKYSDIFCAGPEEDCQITDIAYRPVTLENGKQGVEVSLTLDPPLADISDQSALLETVDQVLRTVDQDNAFMTLIDYDNIRLVLPVPHSRLRKITAAFCCHRCPEGFAYRLGNCVKCETEDCK